MNSTLQAEATTLHMPHADSYMARFIARALRGEALMLRVTVEGDEKLDLSLHKDLIHHAETVQGDDENRIVCACIATPDHGTVFWRSAKEHDCARVRTACSKLGKCLTNMRRITAIHPPGDWL